MLIAIFGSRIGTRTSSGKAGTIEGIYAFTKINLVGTRGFFIESDVIPVDLANQRQMVDQFKKHLLDNDLGLYKTYSSEEISGLEKTVVLKK